MRALFRLPLRGDAAVGRDEVHAARKHLEDICREKLPSGRVLGDCPLDKFGREHVQLVLDRRRAKPEALKGHEALLAIFNWAIPHKLAKENPASQVKPLKSKNPEGYTTWGWSMCSGSPRRTRSAAARIWRWRSCYTPASGAATPGSRSRMRRSSSCSRRANARRKSRVELCHIIEKGGVSLWSRFAPRRSFADLQMRVAFESEIGGDEDRGALVEWVRAWKRSRWPNGSVAPTWNTSAPDDV
jgi:hypothetical protein